MSLEDFRPFSKRIVTPAEAKKGFAEMEKILEQRLRGEDSAPIPDITETDTSETRIVNAPKVGWMRDFEDRQEADEDRRLDVDVASEN